MATTTGGTTYVTSTDLVADYPTASLALANRVDVVASGGPNSIKTAGYTITLADILGGNKFLYNSASPGTFTLPTSGLVDGMVVNVAQIGAGALTVSGGTIVGATVTTAQYQGLQFVYASTGTTWYSVAPNATAPGMTLISTTLMTGSAVNINSCFSATYDNYVAVVTVLNSTDTDLFWRMRNAGTTDSGANYDWQVLTVDGTTLTGIRGLNQTGGRVATALSTTYGVASTTINIYTPFLAQNTLVTGYGFNPVGEASMNNGVGRHQVASSQDSFVLYPGSGSFASGVVRMYGLRN